MQISGLSASNTFSATDVLAIEVNVNGTNKTYKLTGATLATALASIGSYLKTTDVVNNLTSTATTAPLSANMGKTLNDSIKNIISISEEYTDSIAVVSHYNNYYYGYSRTINNPSNGINVGYIHISDNSTEPYSVIFEGNKLMIVSESSHTISSFKWKMIYFKV